MFFFCLIKYSFSQTDKNDWVGEQWRWKSEKKGVKWARKNSSSYTCHRLQSVYLQQSAFPTVLEEKNPLYGNKTLLSGLVNMEWFFCISIDYDPNWTSYSLLYFLKTCFLKTGN